MKIQYLLEPPNGGSGGVRENAADLPLPFSVSSSCRSPSSSSCSIPLVLRLVASKRSEDGSCWAELTRLAIENRRLELPQILRLNSDKFAYSRLFSPILAFFFIWGGGSLGNPVHRVHFVHAVHAVHYSCPVRMFRVFRGLLPLSTNHSALRAPHWNVSPNPKHLTHVSPIFHPRSTSQPVVLQARSTCSAIFRHRFLSTTKHLPDPNPPLHTENLKLET